MSSTRDRILDTAEVCFAQRGFDGTALREITRLAGVNLGAVNYHFGSKEALVRRVFARRMNALHADRIRQLEGLGAAAAPGGCAECALVKEGGSRSCVDCLTKPTSSVP